MELHIVEHPRYPNVTGIIDKNKKFQISPELEEKLRTIYKIPELSSTVAQDTSVQCPKLVKGIVNFFTKHHVK